MKRLVGLILTVAMLITMFPAAVQAKGLKSNSDALTVVESLGLYDGLKSGGTAESNITRGEFADVMVKLLNISWEDGNENLFKDVTAEHPYYKQICMMNKLGIMVGDDNGEFKPEQYVTYAQCVKCIIYILGYSTKAEAQGGYPVGYLLQAGRLEIDDNLNYKEDYAITREALARLIYNSLDVTLIDVEVVSEEKATYSANGNDTILSRYLGIRKFEGILNAVDGRSIMSREEANAKGYVRIGSSVMKYEDASVSQYLGYRVEVYVDTEGGVEKLLCAVPTDKNDELTIKVNDLLLDNSDFSLRTFYYTDAQGRTLHADLTEEHRFVYNGMYDYDFDVDDLDFETGYVQLINNDNDDEYDVCFIWDYNNYAFESAGSEVVKCHYNQSLRYDEDVTYRVLTLDGKWESWNALSSLNSWDVLSIAESKDGKLVTIYINRGGITGTIDAMSYDGEKTIVTIGGRDYVVSAQYLMNMENSGKVAIKNGLHSEFYFDVVGEIAAVYKTSAQDGAYAYLLNAAPVGELSKENWEVKLFTQNGKIEILKTEGKIKFTNDSLNAVAKKPEEVFAAFTQNSQIVPQIIRYSTNEDGILKAVEKSVDATAIGYNTDKFSEDIVIGDIEGTTQAQHYRYQDSTSTFGMGGSYEKRFNINGSTVIIYAPTLNGEIVEEDLAIADSGLFTGGSIYDSFKVYDCDETFNASLMLYSPEGAGDGSTLKEEYFVAVKKVYMGLDDEGNYSPMILGMYKGAEREFVYESADGYIPEKGSILRFEKKLSGELVVKRSNIVYSPTQTTSLYTMKSFADNGSTYLPLVWSQYGRLWRKNGAAITLYTGETLPQAGFMQAGYTIYKIDTEKNITLASDADLITSSGNVLAEADGSLLVFNNRYQYVREMWIIEE